MPRPSSENAAPLYATSSPPGVKAVFLPVVASTIHRLAFVIERYSSTTSCLSSRDQSSAPQPPPETWRSCRLLLASAGFITQISRSAPLRRVEPYATRLPAWFQTSPLFCDRPPSLSSVTCPSD